MVFVGLFTQGTTIGIAGIIPVDELPCRKITMAQLHEMGPTLRVACG